ncbi:hypothetical protein DYB26_011830, partial [Aphanomyces astaci]
ESVDAGSSAAAAAADAGLDTAAVADIVDQVSSSSDNVAAPADVAAAAAIDAGASAEQVADIVTAVDAGESPSDAAADVGLSSAAAAAVEAQVEDSADNHAPAADVAAAAAADAGASPEQVADVAASVDAGASPSDAAADAGLSLSAISKVEEVLGGSPAISHDVNGIELAGEHNMPDVYTTYTTPPSYNETPAPKSTFGRIIDAITSYLTTAPSSPSLRARPQCATSA